MGFATHLSVSFSRYSSTASSSVPRSSWVSQHTSPSVFQGTPARRRVPFLVAHGFRNTPLRQFFKVLQHGVEFRLHVGAIRSGLSNRLVEFLGLFRLVFHILLHGYLEDLVLLRLSVVLGSRGL